MEEYEKKHDHAVAEKETDIPKLTDLLLKVGTQQFLETLSPYITGGEILFDGEDGQTWKFTFDPENKSWQQKCGTESFTDQMMIHELEQKGYEIRKEGGTVINKKAGKSCGKRKIVQISNASSELIKATIQEKHMSYRGLAKIGQDFIFRHIFIWHMKLMNSTDFQILWMTNLIIGVNWYSFQQRQGS